MDDPVQAQLDAYNAQDVDAFCACYHDDVVMEDGHGHRRGQGQDFLRSTYAQLFARFPANRARVVKRMRVGPWVVDEEEVTGRSEQPLHVIAVYLVREGKIATVRFLRPED